LGVCNEMSKPICLDLDGVLHEFSKGWNHGILGKPVKDAVKMTKLLDKNGYDLIVFTTRTNFKDIKAWLKKYKFPKMEVTNIKPQALIYVDDRGYRFSSWQDIAKLFI